MQSNNDGPSLGSPEEVRSYYAPTTQHRYVGQYANSIYSTFLILGRDIASEAYHKAHAFMHKELNVSRESHEIDLLACTTVQEVSAIVEQARARYETSAQGRKGALRWLGRFSARVMYYAQVLDVLAQHHPEYCALAWGSLKFILTVRLCPLCLSGHAVHFAR